MPVVFISATLECFGTTFAESWALTCETAKHNKISETKARRISSSLCLRSFHDTGGCRWAQLFRIEQSATSTSVFVWRTIEQNRISNPGGTSDDSPAIDVTAGELRERNSIIRCIPKVEAAGAAGQRERSPGQSRDREAIGADGERRVYVAGGSEAATSNHRAIFRRP